MATKTYQQILNQLLHVAKLYGVFYLQATNARTKKTNTCNCVIILALFITCHIFVFSWHTKHSKETEFTTTTFLECMTALVLLCCVVSTIICYSFFTQAAFTEFLKVMEEIETIILNLSSAETHLQANSTTLIVNYLAFFSLVCLSSVMWIQNRHFQLQSLSELLFLLVKFHSTNVVIFSLQYIQKCYENVLWKLHQIMVEYLTLPLEEAVQVEDGDFVITGWVKSVLEKRKDEKIECVIISITAAVERLNIAVYLFDKIHRFHIVVLFVVFTTLALGIMNTLSISDTADVIKLLGSFGRSIKVLLFIPFFVSRYLTHIVFSNFTFQLQILEMVEIYSKIASLSDDIGLAAYKYILELSSEDFNLLEYRLFKVLAVLYNCALCRDGRETIVDCSISTYFVFKYVISITSFFAVIIQLNRYASDNNKTY